ncbi:hypothetical protein AA0323_1501 [Asaia siamensis NRIC 0323]|nr:hypothetical protein AA0323_1501 [Asaia siamensis NRIC 0323]
MKWWGPVHEHYAMTDIQSLTLSIVATVFVASVIAVTVRAMKKKRLQTSHIKTL